MKEYLLVFDVGSGTSRVILFDASGTLEGSVSQPRRYAPFDEKDTFLIAFDADVLWSQLCALTRELLQKTGVSPSAIRAATATSQRHSCVFLDATGRVVHASPNQDARGFFTQDTIERQLGNELYTITGQWPSLLSSLARLLWFRQESPGSFERIHTALMLSDWVLYKLTGELTGEPTASSSTCLLDIGRRQWSKRVLDCFSLDSSLLPRLANAGDVVGKLTSRASQECGLAPHTPVVVSGGDTHCALLAAGAVHPGDIGIVAGTTTPVCCIVDEPLIDPDQRIWSTCHLMPDQWILDSNAQWTGAVYQWLHDFLQEELPAMQSEGSWYDLMEDKARSVPPCSNDTYAFLGSVVMDVRNFFVLRPGVFLFPPPTHPMVERPTTLGHLIRATLENICYALRGNMAHLERIYEKRIAPLVRITGGLSYSRLFVEILAECTDLPVSVSKYREGTSLGAAICAAYGMGIYGDLVEAANAMNRFEDTVEPHPDHAAEYKKGYERWRELYHAIADL